MAEINAREFAKNWIQRHVNAGYKLSSLLDYHGGGGGPFNQSPSYNYALNGSVLHFNNDTPSITTKYGSIGVSLQWPDGRCESGEFSIRELWDEITNPHPMQLSLWDAV